MMDQGSKGKLGGFSEINSECKPHGLAVASLSVGLSFVGPPAPNIDTEIIINYESFDFRLDLFCASTHNVNQPALINLCFVM